VITDWPLAALASAATRSTRLGGDHHGRRHGGIGEGVVARGDAAGDLQIDHALAHLVAADGLAQHHGQGRLAHRMGDLQFVQAAPQAREVAGRVGQLAAEHRPHLVDAVGQLVAAILDMHGGLAMAHEAAVHIGETRHSQFLCAVPCALNSIRSSRRMPGPRSHSRVDD
jgi:hypothetical protein